MTLAKVSKQVQEEEVVSVSSRPDYIPEAFSDEDVSFVEQKAAEIWKVELTADYFKGELLSEAHQRFVDRGDLYARNESGFTAWCDRELPFSSDNAYRLIAFYKVASSDKENVGLISQWNPSATASISPLPESIRSIFIELFLPGPLKKQEASIISSLKKDDAVIAIQALERQRSSLDRAREATEKRKDEKSFIDGVKQPEYFRLSKLATAANKSAEKHLKEFDRASKQVEQQESSQIDFDNEAEVKSLIERRLKAKLSAIREEEALKKKAPKKKAKTNPIEPQSSSGTFHLLSYLTHSRALLKDFYGDPSAYPADVQQEIRKSLEELLLLIQENYIT